MQAVRTYVTDRMKYGAKVKEWETFGRIKAPPKVPVPPQHLALWFELQDWPGHLLVAGGLLDQPAWTWDLILLAGHTYLQVTEDNRKTKDLLQDV